MQIASREEPKEIYASCGFALKFSTDQLKISKGDGLHLSHKQLTGEKN